VCGKLLTMTSHFEIPEKPVVDSTGIYFNPMLRHLDRGSQERALHLLRRHRGRSQAFVETKVGAHVSAG